MRQKQWLNYTGKFLAVGILSISSLWVLKPEAAIAWGENCNVFGCSESPGVDCNTLDFFRNKLRGQNRKVGTNKTSDEAVLL